MTYVKSKKMKKILVLISLICSTWNVFCQLPINANSKTFWVNDTLISDWIKQKGGCSIDTSKLVTNYDLLDANLSFNGMIYTYPQKLTQLNLTDGGLGLYTSSSYNYYNYCEMNLAYNQIEFKSGYQSNSSAYYFQPRGFFAGGNYTTLSANNPRWIPDRNYVDSTVFLKQPKLSGTGAVISTSGIISYLPYTYINTGSTLVERDANGNAEFNNVSSTQTKTTSTGQTVPMTFGSAKIQELIGTNNACTFHLPAATYLIQGQQYEFNNDNSGGGTLTVGNNGGTTLFNCPPGGYSVAVCTNNSTTNGGWDSYSYLANNTISGNAGLAYLSNLGSLNLSNPKWLPDKNYVDSAILVHSGATAILNGQSIQLYQVLLKSGTFSEADSLQGFTIHLPSNGTYLLSYIITIVSNTYVLASSNPFNLTFGTTFSASEGNSPSLATLLPSSSNFNAPVYSSSFLYTNTGGSVKIKLYGILGTAPTSGGLSVSGQFLYVLL